MKFDDSDRMEIKRLALEAFREALSVVKVHGPTNRGRYERSPETKAKMAKAQKARWAKAKGKVKTTKKAFA